MSRVIFYQPYQTSLPSQAYLDANFLINLYLPPIPKLPKHLLSLQFRAARFSSELEAKRVVLFTSPLAIDEAVYQLWRMYYQNDYGTNSWEIDPPQVFKRRRTQYTRKLRSFCDSLINRFKPLGYAKSESQIVRTAAANMQQYNLLPRDAFHLAILQAASIPAIITNDPDFQQPKIPKLEVYCY